MALLLQLVAVCMVFAAPGVVGEASASCKAGFSDLGSGNCHHVGTELLTYENAKRKCETMGATLPVLDGNNFYYGLVLSQVNDQSFWLGMTDKASEGSWKWSDGKAVTKFNWKEGDPNGATLANCALILPKYAWWADVKCDREQTYVCMIAGGPLPPRVPAANCPPGWYKYSEGICMKYMSEGRTYEDAELTCGFLRSSLADFNELMASGAPPNPDPYWVRDRRCGGFQAGSVLSFACDDKFPFYCAFDIRGASKGEACTSTAMCAGTLQCLESVCNCSPDEYNSGDMCYRRRDFGEDCRETQECAGNLECIGTVCKCQDGFHNVGNTCLKDLDFGQVCSTSIECAEDLQCVSGVCNCLPGHYNDGNKCYKQRNTGEACTETEMCAGNLQCLANTCGCPPQDYNVGNTCVKKLSFNEVCSSSIMCAGDLQCISGVCHCLPGHYNDGRWCHKQHGFNVVCSDTRQCAGDLECISGVCHCLPGYYNDGNKCHKQLEVGGACSADNMCAGDLECISSVCKCPPGEYNVGNTCMPNRGIGEACTSSDMCAGDLECLDTPIGPVCTCPEGEYNVGNTCHKKLNVGDACTETRMCDGDLECLDFVCKCPPGDHVIADNKCEPDHGFGEDCTDSDMCADNLKCIDSVCKCPEGEYNVGNTCFEKLNVGDACTETRMCDGDLECIDFVCRCPDGMQIATGNGNVCEIGGCAGTEYGCCPDGVTTATGPNFEGCWCFCCPTQFGCCPDGVTTATGPNNAGCDAVIPEQPSKTEVTNALKYTEMSDKDKKAVEKLIRKESKYEDCCSAQKMKCKAKDEVTFIFHYRDYMCYVDKLKNKYCICGKCVEITGKCWAVGMCLPEYKKPVQMKATCFRRCKGSACTATVPLPPPVEMEVDLKLVKTCNCLQAP